MMDSEGVSETTSHLVMRSELGGTGWSRDEGSTVGEGVGNTGIHLEDLTQTFEEAAAWKTGLISTWDVRFYSDLESKL